MARRSLQGGGRSAEGRVARWRRRARRWLAGLAIALVTPLVLAAAILVGLDLGWERERLVAFAVERVEEQIGIEIEVGEAIGRLSRGIELRNVRIGDSDAPLATLTSVRIRWDVSSLLSEEGWVANEIRVDGWTVGLRRSASGEWAVLGDLMDRLRASAPSLSDPEEPDGSGPGLWIRRIELGEGELGLIVERREAEREPSPQPVARSPLRATLRAQGRIRDLRVGATEPLSVRRGRFDARLVAIDTGAPEYDRAATGRLRLRLVGNRLESIEAELTAPGLALTGRAAGRVDHFDELVMEIEARDLAPLSDWIQADAPLAGEVDARVDLSGPIAALVGSAHIRGRALRIEGFEARELEIDGVLDSPVSRLLRDPLASEASVRIRARGLDPGGLDRGLLPPGLADLELEGVVHQGAFDLRRGHLSLAGLEVEASGRGSRTHLEQLDLRLAFEDLAPWLHAWRPDLPVAGRLAGEAHLEGPLQEPFGRVALRSDSVLLAGGSLGALELLLERGESRLLDLELMLGPTKRPHLSGRARVDPERERVDFDLVGRAETWSDLLDRVPAIRGDLVSRGFVERTPQGPHVAVAIQADDTFVADVPLGRLELVAESRSAGWVEVSTLALDGEAGSLLLKEPAILRLGDDGSWSLTDAALEIRTAEEPTAPAAVSLSAAGVRALLTSGEAAIEALPLSLANRFWREGPGLGGRLSGRARWQRARSTDWTVGGIEWVEPRIGGVRLDRVGATWTSTPTEVDLRVESGLAGLAPLTVQGRIPLPERASEPSERAWLAGLALQAELDAWDLSALESLSPRWMRSIEGRVSGSIDLEHDGSGVLLDGRATITQGGFTIPLLRQRFAPVDALVTFADGRISIEHLRVGGPQAGALLVGSVDLSAQRSPALDGKIRFDHLPLSRSPVAWMDLGGELRLTGTLALPVLRGELSVENGGVGVPAARDPVAKEIRMTSQLGTTSITEDEEGGYDPLAAADVDVVVTVPGSTRVRGRQLNLFVEGEARFVKPSPERLRIRGEARVLNGTYTFQGRRFHVRRGRVLMTGGELFDPLLDIEATHRVADIVAIVELAGPLSAPIVQLRSEPPLSEQDVLAYVLFGRPMEESQTTDEARYDAAAARLAAGVTEAELREMLGEDMPIDTIEIEAGEEGEVSEFGFGKYVGPRLFLRYMHVLGDEPSDRVGAEYRLNENFSIGNSVSTTGDVGIDLILRHDF